MENALKILSEETGAVMDYFEELTSTNDQARDERYGNGAVVMAERQSAGRGQRGNKWCSSEGLNLTFSVVLYPEWVEARDQFYISKAVALAVADTLLKIGLSPSVKWPNDIYIGDRKVGGILIENDLTDQYISKSIVGIGLNVNQTEFDPALPNPTSLALATGQTFARDQLFRLFYRCLSARYGQLMSEDFLALDADYIHLLYRFGKKHLFADGATEGRFLGTICGVRPTGELEVRRADGNIYAYLFKEIEFIVEP